MKVAVGTYTGNGTSQSITGLGALAGTATLSPALGGVIIKAPGSISSNDGNGVIRLGTMTGDKTKDIFSIDSVYSNVITSLDADGFSVGSGGRGNTNGRTYCYVAWEADDTDSSIGSYTGNGADNRVIPTGLDDHDLVIIVAEHVFTRPVWRTTLMSGDVTMTFENDANLTNCIEDQAAGDFEVGTDGFVNANAQTYHFAAFKISDVLNVLTWTGNGADNRSITGAGFQPTFAVVGRLDGDAVFHRFGGQVGDASQAFDWEAETNRIQAFESDGFQVGSADSVNKNGIAIWSFVMTDGESAPAVVESETAASAFLPVYGATQGGPHITSSPEMMVY